MVERSMLGPEAHEGEYRSGLVEVVTQKLEGGVAHAAVGGTRIKDFWMPWSLRALRPILGPFQAYQRSQPGGMSREV